MADEHFTFPTRDAQIHFDDDKEYTRDHRAADAEYNQFVLEDWLNRKVTSGGGDSLWTYSGGDLAPTTQPTNRFTVRSGDAMNLSTTGPGAGASINIVSAKEVLLESDGDMTIDCDNGTLLMETFTLDIQILSNTALILRSNTNRVRIFGIPVGDPGVPATIYQDGSGALFVSP